MKKANILMNLGRVTLLGVSLTAGLFHTSSAQAGAVATDARTGASGIGRVWEGSPSRQQALAVDRAIRNGGSAATIRSYQFNVPAGCYVAYYIGWVPGKGWAGNWSYAYDPNTAQARACDGLIRQNASSIQFYACWQE